MWTCKGFLCLTLLLNLIILCLTEFSEHNFIVEFDTYLTNTNVELYEANSVIDCARTCSASSTCQYAAFNNQTVSCMVPNNIAHDSGTYAPGWMFIKRTVPVACADCVRFGSSWYKFSNAVVTMTDAQSACVSLGGKLVEVETELENSFVKIQLSALNYQPTGFWMGAYSVNADSSYRWSSSPNEPMLFADFGQGEPSHVGTENCLAFYRSIGYKWVDIMCTELLPYVCELSV